MPTEGDDFYGHRPCCAELVRKLGFVDDDGQALAGLGDDFLAQQGAASTFDDVESGINLHPRHQW